MCYIKNLILGTSAVDISSWCAGMRVIKITDLLHSTLHTFRTMCSLITAADCVGDKSICCVTVVLIYCKSINVCVIVIA